MRKERRSGQADSMSRGLRMFFIITLLLLVMFLHKLASVI